MGWVFDEKELARHMSAKYGKSCPLCGSRIDEDGLCTCDAGGG